MNESTESNKNVTAAVDALVAKKQQGNLPRTGRKNSLASLLRQRIDALKSLHEDLSASALASELSSVGFKVSASTVQRVLRDSTLPKRRKTSGTPIQIPATKPGTRSTTAASHAPVTPPPAVKTKNPTDTEALLKKMQKEAGLIDTDSIKTTASLKTKSL